MSGFLTDYSFNNSCELLPEGEYETVVKYIREDYTKSGKKQISIMLIVRNDINQDNKNRCIWYNINKTKFPSKDDKDCEGYSSFAINKFSEAIGFVEGTCCESIDEWINEVKLDARSLRVRVKHEKWNDKTYVQVIAVMPSNYPDIKHVF